MTPQPKTPFDTTDLEKEVKDIRDNAQHIECVECNNCIDCQRSHEIDEKIKERQRLKAEVEKVIDEIFLEAGYKGKHPDWIELKLKKRLGLSANGGDDLK